MSLVKTEVKIDATTKSLVLVEEIEADFDNEPDEAISIVATFPDGSKMADIAAAVAKKFELGQTGARNRLRKAFGIKSGMRGDTGHAVEWESLTLWLERADPRNDNSGLILRVNYRDEAGQVHSHGEPGWTCFGKVESSPMSGEELEDAAATVYERI